MMVQFVWQSEKWCFGLHVRSKMGWRYYVIKTSSPISTPTGEKIINFLVVVLKTVFIF